ncbi:uncharacterized protein (DUF58 family) [Amycolatopsis bartoniae]|uniref:Lipoprotein n=1 Tax=Amycolatopsis bartoniae TaxID=941986 RepID=A0A8H9IY81_9PSEU|nr:DUF58 domain-containing protein [Amycolatopsis bartoniae]MBB2938863.1 uncharacterized protein (DUF58 family) [Amycolatopsis bartoniae]TVT00689.1 DUF58 domain-containing protein [Amycolatopsis bartoniae]GHF77180.1 lipoprotein [Amycolatopsis bartoniae]
MAITARVGVLAAIGAVVVGLAVPSWGGVAAVFAVLVVLVLVDLALAGGVRGLGFTRSGETSTRLGEPVEVRLAVTNPGRRVVRGVVRDAWPPSAGVVRDRQALVVPAGESRVVSFELRPTRRGERRADRVTVRSVGPLGLAARQGSHRVPWAVRVLPPFHSRRHLPSRLARLQQLDGRQAALVRGAGTEFDSLREYVVGDDVRSIDWRATARARDVMVRTWRPERDRHVLLVLDTGRTSAGRVGDEPRLDAMMEAALLLATLASRAGDRVDLLAYDRQLRASVRGGSVPALVNALALLEPALVETDARGLVGEVLRRTPHRSLVVLLTGLDAAPLEEGLLPVLPALSARHGLVVASVTDPRLTEMARGRGDAEAVYEAAAAERSLAERRHVSGLLRRRGVEVVDAEPAELPPALADRYLALKATGRL